MSVEAVAYETEVLKITKIRKRDGKIVSFNKEKITEAIWKAVKSVGGTDRKKAEELANKVVDALKKEGFNSIRIPTVEDVQNFAEKILIENGHAKTAKAYILYRQDRSKIREEAKKIMNGRFTSMYKKISLNSLRVLAGRYLMRDTEGNVLESPEDMFERVARALSEVEKLYGKDDDFVQEMFKNFYEVMFNLEFLPAGRSLANAGASTRLVSNCIVLHFDDSMKGIFETLKDASLLQQAGSGLGFPFHLLRPAGSVAVRSRGVASGPVSFLKVYDKSFGVIKQQGRHGANMAVMKCLSGETEISTINGRKKIKDLVGTNPYVYCLDETTGEIKIKKSQQVIKTDNAKKLVRVRFDDDIYLECTPDHLIMLSDGRYKQAIELKQFDSLMSFHKNIMNGKYFIGTTISSPMPEHILIAESAFGVTIKQGSEKRRPTDLCVHHKDGNPLNNDPSNLKVITFSEHSRIHSEGILEHQKTIAKRIKGKKLEEVYDNELVMKWKKNMSKSAKEREPWNKKPHEEDYKKHYDVFRNQYSNHKVVSVEEIEGLHDVYDMTVPELHNFIANGIFVHNCDHPDVLEFINCKEREGDIRNFNISVSVTDEFMQKVLTNDPNSWVTEWNHLEVKPRRVLRDQWDGVISITEETITPREIMEEIATAAWRNGEPGVIFIDTVNRTNPVPALGSIEACNPCGEQMLHDGDVCNLGSINLEKFVNDNRKIDWDRLGFVTRTAIRMLDNVIDITDFPVEKVNRVFRGNRRIGLGIMGFADMLIKLKVPYNSEQGRQTAEQVMSFIETEAVKMSQELAEEKGVFPNWHLSTWAAKGMKMRNAALTTIAPTGSISMICDISSGVEPYFALVYAKSNIMGGQSLYYANKYLEKELRERGIYSDELMKKISETGSVQTVEKIPEDIRKIFIIALDISPEDHVKMQASFQKYIDNSISKTINLPANATKEDVMKAYILAWQTGCKSITVYRASSRQVEVLHLLKEKEKQSEDVLEPEEIRQTIETPVPTTSGILVTKSALNQMTNCAECGSTALDHVEGCVTCKNCGWSVCSL